MNSGARHCAGAFPASRAAIKDEKKNVAAKAKGVKKVKVSKASKAAGAARLKEMKIDSNYEGDLFNSFSTWLGKADDSEE